ncbi:MAG: GFA family protein [Pseudomonadota bacterium]
MDWTGGCLCGAVRYRASAAPVYASYCHCSMCRKASGAPFSGFVEFPDGSLDWTEGEASRYVSSEDVVRRFCPSCGSQLTFEADGITFVTLGSLDHPEAVSVVCHTYTSTRLPGIDLADGLPHFPGPAGGKGGKPVG